MSQLLSLRRVNDLLLVILILLALYIMVTPLAPALGWWFKHQAPLISSPMLPKISLSTAKIPDTNTLLIPALNLTEKIYEGDSIYTVNKGVWRRPQTSTPDKGSNTVLVGHRFTYHGPAVFYHLDKVKVDDQIVLYWNGKAYEYKVASVREVPPTELSVEAPTIDPTLTVYTCTPLVTAKNRLVIQARLVNTL